MQTTGGPERKMARWKKSHDPAMLDESMWRTRRGPVSVQSWFPPSPRSVPLGFLCGSDVFNPTGGRTDTRFGRGGACGHRVVCSRVDGLSWYVLLHVTCSELKCCTGILCVIASSRLITSRGDKRTLYLR